MLRAARSAPSTFIAELKRWAKSENMHKGATQRVAEMMNRTSPTPKHFERDLTDDELAFIEAQLRGDGKLGDGVRFEMARSRLNLNV